MKKIRLAIRSLGIGMSSFLVVVILAESKLNNVSRKIPTTLSACGGLPVAPLRGQVVYDVADTPFPTLCQQKSEVTRHVSEIPV